ncbi:MAG: hypothetical protein ACRDT4_01535 [Micromonosporaceae bacterium]
MTGTAGTPPRWTRLTVPGALAVARAHCTVDCFPYHSLWRLFRRTGLKGHPGWHAGFFRAHLNAPRDPQRPVRALVCAASDEAMLATVLACAGPRVAAHMVDACETPLILAAEYARRHHVELTVEQARLPAASWAPGRFDVVVTDGLLSLLPSGHDRDALLAQLADRLDPGGRLLYTTRITRSGSVLEYDLLGRAVQAVAARWTWRGGPAQRRELAARVRSRTSRPSPFGSLTDLRQAFGGQFDRVRLFVRHDPASVALRVHPDAWRGAGSVCVGVLATQPRSP